MLAVGLVVTPLGNKYEGLFPHRFVLAALLVLQSICSYEVNVLRFWETCHMPAWCRNPRPSTKMWWWADFLVASTLAAMCSLNSLKIPFRHSMYMASTSLLALSCLHKGRLAARRNCLFAYLFFHSLWHYLPPFFYTVYIVVR